LLAREKRISEMAGAPNPRRPSRDPDLLLPPDPDGPPVPPPPFARRMNRGKCRLAETGSSSTTMMMWVSPRGGHALMWMAVVGRRSFSLSDKAVDAPTLIVGERPIAALRLGRDVSAAGPSRSEPLAPHPSRLACRKGPATNVDLRLKAAGDRPASALRWLGSMQAYALLAAVHVAFGAGVSRA
jgi:hypothetical protein